jgi:hypothetical protein
MKISIFALVIAIPAYSTYAATHAILPGEAIQPVINAAAAGDVIALFGGTYPDNITINKAVRLVEADGEDVTLLGNITWSGVSNAPPFEGFTVGSPGHGIAVENTTGLIFKQIDARNAGNLEINGTSTIDLIDSKFSGIRQTGGSVCASLCTIDTSFQTVAGSQKTVALRTAMKEARWESTKSYFGYSSTELFEFTGNNCKVVLVGSKIDSVGRSITGVDLWGSSSYQVMNNTIKGGHRGLQMRLSTNPYKSYVLNNYITTTSTNAYEVMWIETPNWLIANNILDKAQYGLRAPFGVDARNNLFWRISGSTEYGGVIGVGSLAADPLMVPGQEPKLYAGSPCINAGTTDPSLNDLDGTRNDIGPGGGCMFDPDVMTTNKPVVISFDLGPRRLVKGRDTGVNLSNGQAAAGQ